MTGRSVPVRRIAALAVSITLVVVPIAAAQAPAPASPGDASAGPVFLSPTAFVRLVQPPPAEVAPAAAVADPPRIDVLRQSRAAVARQAQAAPTKAPQQKRWWSRHGWIVIVGAVAGLLVLWAFLLVPLTGL